MGWTQPHAPGTGTTGQVEEAHRALDVLGVAPGPLALRTIALSAQLHDAADEVVRLQGVLGQLQQRVERLENPSPPEVFAALAADSDRRVAVFEPAWPNLFEDVPVVTACIAAVSVDGAAPNAVWCPVHRCFHPYAGSAPADAGTAG